MREKKKDDTRSFHFFSNLVFMWKAHWRFDRVFLALPVLQIPFVLGASLVGIALPKVVLDGLNAHDDFTRLLTQVALLSAALMLCKVLEVRVRTAMNVHAWKFYALFGMEAIVAKKMSIDYQVYSSPKGKVAAQKALRAVSNNIYSSAVSFFPQLKEVVVNLLGFAAFSAILSTLNPWIILFLLLSYLLDGLVALLLEKQRDKLRETESAHWRKSSYLTGRVALSAYAKDIRIYTLTGWLRALREQLLAQELKVAGKQGGMTMLQLVLGGVLVFLRDGLAYAYLIQRMLADPTMEIGIFTVYFAAIAGFGSWLANLVVGGSSLLQANNFVKHFRVFMGMGEETAAGKALPQKATHSIQLENVCFRYPESDKVILQDINLTIAEGENLAIVGVNGAGKTTLVNLICGLLHPTSGRILLDGTDSRDFTRADYFSLFSAVFQDVGIMPVTLAQNVTYCCEMSVQEEERLWQMLEQADFAARVRQLPLGIHSPLLKQFHKDGVEFSGGEMQKLLLARALYPDAPILILDEPTAALDPIAENELYLKYHSLTAGKTSLYISHRLSSTRFCDRIILLDGAEIAQSGTHEELMRQGGKYAEMFAVSSKYYQEGAGENDA